MISILSILLIVSAYQLFVFMMHDLLDKELQSWQGQEFAPDYYAPWENQRPLVDLLVSLSPYSGAVLQSSARFYQLGAELAPNNLGSYSGLCILQFILFHGSNVWDL